jgi:hypothetical protein
MTGKITERYQIEQAKLALTATGSGRKESLPEDT